MGNLYPRVTVSLNKTTWLSYYSPIYTVALSLDIVLLVQFGKLFLNYIICNDGPSFYEVKHHFIIIIYSIDSFRLILLYSLLS